jgi:hypothetical protein
VTSNCKTKVLKQTMDIPTPEMEGPTLFFHMMQVIIHMTEDTTRAITQQFSQLITPSPGKNVEKVVSLLQGSLLQWQMVNKVLHDVVEKLIKVFQALSVNEFHEIFKLMRIC